MTNTPLTARIRRQTGSPTAVSTAEPMDLSALRASLVPSGPPPGPLAAAAAPRLQRRPAVVEPAMPDAAAVLASSANAQRLCLTYDGVRRSLNRRARMQRIGIGALVSAVMVAAAVPALQQRLSMALLHDVVTAAGVLGAVALGVLATLWMRDQRRLHRLQGDRLVRALGLNCSLAHERIDPWLHEAPAGVRFFELYVYWRSHSAAAPMLTS